MERIVANIDESKCTVGSGKTAVLFVFPTTYRQLFVIQVHRRRLQ